MGELSCQIEGLLVVATSPVKLQTLYELAGQKEVDESLVELQSFWNGRGLELVITTETACLICSKAAQNALNQLEAFEGRKLTEAAVSTLCYIAINQPVTLKDIENARGVKLFKGLLDSLMDAGFVRAASRKTDSGRAMVYVTTEKLLEHFGLSSSADFPTADELMDMMLEQSGD